MKKTLLISFTIFCFFILSGCTKENKQEEATPFVPGYLQDIKGPVVQATLDDKGNIIIKEGDITTIATYISYDVDGVVVGLLAVKDSKGNVKVVVNTCQSCGGSPYAYFIQVGNQIECQNCTNRFDIDNLDNLVEDGCNPIPIKERTDKDGIITIGTKQLRELKDKFENWLGPKA